VGLRGSLTTSARPGSRASGWLQELTGNPGQVSGAAETWDNVAAYLEETAQELTQSVTGRLAAQHSMAVDAYKSLQQDSADHLTRGGRPGPRGGRGPEDGHSPGQPW